MKLRRPSAVAVTHGGDRVAAALAGGVVVVASSSGQVPLLKKRTDVRGLAWSPDGSKLALWSSSFHPPRTIRADVEVIDVASKQVVARGHRPMWSTVGHGTAGGVAPLLVWSPDGKHVYCRSAETSEADDGPRNAIGHVDVDAGAFHLHVLPSHGDGLLFALWATAEHLYAQISACGLGCGLHRFERATMKHLANRD